MQTLDPNGEYWMYLRKSRADMEAEARGEGETLKKHRNALLRFAKQHNLIITKVFPEVVSGESLLHREEMLKMLKEMEESPPTGVLCMDIDRLGRGDKVDQGIIERSFKENRVLIITPSETYNLNQDAGEFNVEVRSFLARLELKQINKRLQGGRVRSIEEGNYIGTRPPFGYLIHKTDRERFLVPCPEQAPIVKLIFDRYVNGNCGANKIANELNSMGSRSYSGKQWTSSSILTVIKNAVYIGRIQWKKKEYKKSVEPGKRRDSRTRPQEEWIDVKGKHEPLVSEEIFYKAQDILKRKYHVPYQLENGITNPLAGLIRCGKCNASMVLRPYTSQPAHLRCYNQLCDNKSTRFSYVEEKLVNSLRGWMSQYKAQWGPRKRTDDNQIAEIKQAALKNLEKQLQELMDQKGNLHDFLERKIYTLDVFLERSQLLAERIESVQSSIEQTKKDIQLEQKRAKAQKEIIPRIESVLKLHHKSKDPAKKNELLKQILNYAVYTKEKTQRNDEFKLEISVILPKQ